MLLFVYTRFQAASINSLKMAEHFRECHAQCIGDDFDIPKRDVPAAAFYPANVGTIQATLVSEGFLGEAGFGS